MNCNISEQERKIGMRCRSFDCIPCKEHLTSKDRGIIDNEIIKMLMKENKRLELEVKHGCSICALQPDIAIRDLESKLKAQQELIEKLERENKIMKYALTIYADDKKYDRDGCLILEVDENLGEISDEGFTAREALAKLEKKNDH